MSIYSGFATRVLETQYNSQLYSLLLIMSKRLVGFYQGIQVKEDIFSANMMKTLQQLTHLEDSKYLQPKFTKATQMFSEYLQQQNLAQEDRSEYLRVTHGSFEKGLKLRIKGNSASDMNQKQLNNSVIQQAQNQSDIARTNISSSQTHKPITRTSLRNHSGFQKISEKSITNIMYVNKQIIKPFKYSDIFQADDQLPKPYMINFHQQMQAASYKLNKFQIT